MASPSSLHNTTHQVKEDLTTFSYEVQSLAKRAIVNSPIETQNYVAARQFVEGIADLEVQRIVRLSSPRTLQDARDKALEIQAATKATRMTRRRRNPLFRTTLETTEKFTCWRCGQKGHLRVGCLIKVGEMKVNVEEAAEYKSNMKFMHDTINSVKEQLKNMKNLLKKN
nr:unnamed protein product [Callosobruchus chinensis]